MLAAKFPPMGTCRRSFHDQNGSDGLAALAKRECVVEHLAKAETDLTGLISGGQTLHLAHSQDVVYDPSKVVCRAL